MHCSSLKPKKSINFTEFMIENKGICGLYSFMQIYKFLPRMQTQLAQSLVPRSHGN